MHMLLNLTFSYLSLWNDGVILAAADGSTTNRYSVDAFLRYTANDSNDFFTQNLGVDEPLNIVTQISRQLRISICSATYFYRQKKAVSCTYAPSASTERNRRTGSSTSV